jgi:hypothetical protein
MELPIGSINISAQFWKAPDGSIYQYFNDTDRFVKLYDADQIDGIIDILQLQLFQNIKLTTISDLREFSGDLTYTHYYIIDKGKEGIWAYDSTDVTSDDNLGTILVDSDGRRFKRDYNGCVYVNWFGAKGDALPYNFGSGTDDTAAIQAAIDFIIYSEVPKKSRELKFNAGCYRTTDVIHLGYGQQYSSIILSGAGKSYPYDNNANAMYGTCFQADQVDRPCFNIQGARNTTIQGIKIWGQNDFQGSGYSRDMLNISNYYDPGTMGTVRDSRYGPYAAISVDAYTSEGGVRPEDGYPDPAYPIYITPGWDKKTSSVINIIDCSIANFICGIVVMPSGGDQNGDFINIDKCNINSNKFGISVGQTQAREVNITNSQIDLAYVLLTTGHHGKLQGKLTSFIGCHFSGNQLFYCKESPYNSPTKFLNCYAENIYNLGWFGDNRTNNLPISFDGCQFSFNHGDLLKIPNYIIQRNDNGQITFNDCKFSGIAFGMKAGKCTLNRCSFDVYMNFYNNSGFDISIDTFAQLAQFSGFVFARYKIMVDCVCTVIKGDDYGFYKLQNGDRGDNPEFYDYGLLYTNMDMKRPFHKPIREIVALDSSPMSAIFVTTHQSYETVVLPGDYGIDEGFGGAFMLFDIDGNDYTWIKLNDVEFTDDEYFTENEDTNDVRTISTHRVKSESFDGDDSKAFFKGIYRGSALIDTIEEIYKTHIYDIKKDALVYFRIFTADPFGNSFTTYGPYIISEQAIDYTSITINRELPISADTPVVLYQA